MTILINLGNLGNYVMLVMVEHELKTPKFLIRLILGVF